MSLIVELKWGDVGKLTSLKLKALPCMELLDEDGKYFATLIIPSMAGGTPIYDDVKTRAEYLGVTSNSVLPQRTVEEALAEVGDSKRQKMLDNLTKARAARKEKKELVNAVI